MNTNETIISRVREARIAAGLSQIELSRRIEGSPNLIQKIEAGTVKNPSKHLDSISRELKKPLSYFYGEETAELTGYAEKAKVFDEMLELLAPVVAARAGGGAYAAGDDADPETATLMAKFSMLSTADKKKALELIRMLRAE